MRKFLIGEVSKLYSISMDTLRYYDKINLLKPLVDKTNNYRYYLPKHLEQLNMILITKELGIPLKAIKDTIDSEDIHKYKELIYRQEEILEEKIKKLQYLKTGISENKVVFDEIINYKPIKNIDDVEKRKINYKMYSFDMSNIINLDIDSIINTMPKDKGMEFMQEFMEYDDYFYKYEIINNKLIEHESTLTLKESEEMKEIIDKLVNMDNINLDLQEINEEVIITKFYGNENEFNEYILKLNKKFNIKDVFVKYDFYMPKKVESETVYFANIICRYDYK